MQEIIDNFLEILPYLLLALFIVAEIACLAITGSDLFVLAYRAINRKMHNSESHKMISIPHRLKAQIANENLEVGTAIKVVKSLPLIPESGDLLLTSQETGAEVGTVFYLAEINRNSLTISAQSMFTPN